MTTIIERQTATILQFPIGGRKGWHDLAGGRAQANAAPQTGPQVEFSDLAFGGSWYHEDALHKDDATPGLVN